MPIDHEPPRCAVTAEVVDVQHICREHVRIELCVAEFAASEPGQFLQLLCSHELDEQERVVEWREGTLPQLGGAAWDDSATLLRRPFSIADHWNGADGRTHLVVISRAVGRGTRWLDALRPGATLDITGPLGRGFRLPADDRPMALIGGGVGIPPLLYLARRLHERGHTCATAIFGALTRDLLPLAWRSQPAADGTPTSCVALPGDAPYGTIVTTDDGSAGLAGRVTAGLAAWNARLGADAADALVCACGPERMLAALAEQTRQLGLACQLCIERPMGCGLGTCLSCVVRVRADEPSGWRWALACSDGPVFDRDELVDVTH